MTLLTYCLYESYQDIVLRYGTIRGMIEERKIRKNREELDNLAQSLPGVNSPARCPLWKEKPNDKYTAREWELFCRGGQRDLLRVIMHLNDHHEWTREQIADFVQEQHDAGLINVSFEEKLFANRKVTT